MSSFDIIEEYIDRYHIILEKPIHCSILEFCLSYIYIDLLTCVDDKKFLRFERKHDGRSYTFNWFYTREAFTSLRSTFRSLKPEEATIVRGFMNMIIHDNILGIKYGLK